MKKILITGGAGFIGSHTSFELLRLGYELIIIDSFINASDITLKNALKTNKFNSKIQIIRGDIRDINLIDEIFSESITKNKKIEAVIHFSGLKAVGESVSNPLLYWDNNVLGTIQLLKVMNKYRCHILVFSSSATVYGDCEDSLLNEDSNISPKNPYGNTKFVIENLLSDLFKSNKSLWKIACLRYFNPIGSHPDRILGEEPLNTPNNIFPIINKVALGEIKHLEVYGNDWPTEDGTAIRDYIHIQDLAFGHIKTLETLHREEPQILKLNLGTGIGTSVLKLVKTFEQVNKVKVPYIFSNRRKGDSAFTVADNSKALQKLNWKPFYDLHQMCKDGWNWYSKQE